MALTDLAKNVRERAKVIAGSAEISEVVWQIAIADELERQWYVPHSVVRDATKDRIWGFVMTGASAHDRLDELGFDLQMQMSAARDLSKVGANR